MSVNEDNKIMNNLVSIDLKEAENLIKPVLEKFPVIAGAYFFGSALEQCRADSDIDLGLVLSSKFNLPEKKQDLLVAKILNETPRLGNHQFDITILTKDNVFFTHRVLRTGKLFYDKNTAELTDFIELVSHKYRVNYPRYRRALEIIATEV